MDFGERVKTIRLRNYMTAYDLATALDVSPGYVSKIETGRTIPSPGMVKMIALSLGYDTFHLLALARSDLIHRYTEKIRKQYGS